MISHTKQKVFLKQRKKYFSYKESWRNAIARTSYTVIWVLVLFHQLHTHLQSLVSQIKACTEMYFNQFSCASSFWCETWLWQGSPNSLFNETLSRTFLMKDIISLLIIRSHTTLVVANFVIKFKRVDNLVPLSQTMPSIIFSCTNIGKLEV